MAFAGGKSDWQVRYPAHPSLFRLGVVAADDDLATVEGDLLDDGARRERLDGAWRRSATTGRSPCSTRLPRSAG